MAESSETLKIKAHFRSNKIQSCSNCKHLNHFGTQCLLMNFWLRRPSADSVCDRWHDQGEDTKLTPEEEFGFRKAEDDEPACSSCCFFEDEECRHGFFPVKEPADMICDNYDEP